MRKAITLTLSIALLGVFAAVVVAAVGPSDGTSTLPASSTGTTAETTTTDRTTTAPDRTTTAPAGIDISGPCDEAEHANDPRCTGVGVGDHGRVDNSGPGNAGDDFDDGDFYDDSSGPGPGGDDDDFDDFDDDSSGSGHGGGDNSGPGGGDD